MTKFFSLFAVASLALTGNAVAASDQQRFTHEGVTYVFTSTKTNDGATVLTGRSQPGDLPFRLSVRDGRVRGHAGGTPVSFRVADSRGASNGARVQSTTAVLASTAN
ncbi:hypothetical protein [Sphingomonas sp. RS2018]